jgi:hypothetical protein
MTVLEAAHQSSDGTVQFVGVDTRDEPGAGGGVPHRDECQLPTAVRPAGRHLLEYTRIQGLPVTPAAR